MPAHHVEVYLLATAFIWSIHIIFSLAPGCRAQLDESQAGVFKSDHFVKRNIMIITVHFYYNWRTYIETLSTIKNDLFAPPP